MPDIEEIRALVEELIEQYEIAQDMLIDFIAESREESKSELAEEIKGYRVRLEKALSS